MLVVDQFHRILAKENVSELIPFLKSLEKADKKEMTAIIKSVAKEYLEFRQETSVLGLGNYKQKASKVQGDMIYATGLFCMNRKDYQKLDSFNHFIGNTLVENILPWYCPDWFSDRVNEVAKQDWMPWNFDYQSAMGWVEKGYLNPSDELIAKLIPSMIFPRDEKNKYNYEPERLLRRPITLQKHIWFVFQYETNIHYSDRYLQFNNSSKEVLRWMHALKKYTDEGLIDRQQLLRESILATNRNFNKVLTGWFVDLFEFMVPNPAELLALQAELNTALNSRHSKAINAALNGVKEIINEPVFDVRGFLDTTPILLSSETKAIVSKTLSVIEKIIRKNQALAEYGCICICQAFIQNNEEIQNKASNLLVKYHTREWQAVNDEIKRYSESLLMSSRKSLAAFIENVSAATDELQSSLSVNDNSIQPIEEVTNLDELIFLASQAFDNNDPLHIDLMPAALVNFQHHIDGSLLVKLEPALQRAYKLVIGDWPSTMGYLDHLLATFFIDVTKLFITRFPKDGSSLQRLHDEFNQKDIDNKAKWSWYSKRILELGTWSVQSKDTTYIIHKAVLINAYEKIKISEQAPILSTPTHSYGYIDPVILVKRLAMHADKNILPDNYDFQLAISRIGNFNQSTALQDARGLLKGEVLSLMEFLLEEDAKPKPPFTTEQLWFMAGLRKSPQKKFTEFSQLSYASLPHTMFTGEVPWKSFVDHYQSTRYNYQKGKNESIQAKRNILRLTLNSTFKVWDESLIEEKSLLSKLAQLVGIQKKEEKRNKLNILYEFLSLKAQYLSAEHNDIQRFVYLFPSNPNPLLALIAARCLEYSTFSSETDKRLVTGTLEALINLRFDYTEMSYLFIATCMLTSDKTVRSFAAELWLNGVASCKVDSARLGRIVGIHFSGEYAPIKRFTDLVSENMMRISSAHNNSLEHLLTSIIENIQIEPPVGTKRLLELYSETLSLNNSTVLSERAKQNLNLWVSSANMRKIIESLY